MTLQGWDTSHFDGPITRATTDRAYAEGHRFLTAKLGEGLTDTEGRQDDTTLANARDSGFPFLGGYLIPRSNATPAAQVAYWVQLADAGEPWWRSFPGWFWQVDLERWPYDNVPASVGIDCARRLRDATGRAVILYASRGQYGDQLAAWDGPLWNADYRGGPGYPGDGWTVADKGAVAGWAPYSGKVPAILQYTSLATIAGLTTCDANAFRGSVADFAALIGVPRVEAKREVIGMPFLSRDNQTGAIYLCTDDFKSHHIPDPATVSTIVGSHVSGARPLGHDSGAHSDWWLPWADSAGVEVPGIVLTGWTPEAFGSVAEDVTVAVTVAMTDTDRAAIIAGVAAELVGKLDQVAAAVAALGIREAAAAQAEADALKG